VFGASIILNRSEITAFPKNLTPELDAARAFSSDLYDQVSDGLGIKIPMDIGADAYIEIVKDYQPQISRLVGQVLNSSKSQASSRG
jgi:hypothetical protein